MKALTYEDWLKNPVPRDMWVWDDFEKDKVVRKVIFFIEKEDAQYPVISIIPDGYGTSVYMHCAEIETTKLRRFTYKELSRWLREKPNREYMHITSDFICCHYDYREETQDKEVCKDIRIREDDGEWKEPLVEEIE